MHQMSSLPPPFDSFFGTVLPFLIMLGIIVFVHEFGHFIVARWCGVKVETFSIGFGKEIFGRTDRHGTRWKLSALPLGGYVKFEGDLNAASIPDFSKPVTPTSFNSKSLWQKAAVVAAGPIANFLLAILLFAGILMFVGEDQIPPRIDGFSPHRTDGFLPNSPAEEAGLLPGDVIKKISGSDILTFQDLQKAVFYQGGTPLALVVERNGKMIDVTVTPRIKTVSDGYGGTMRIGLLGIRHDNTKDERLVVKYGPVQALTKGASNTWLITSTTLRFVGKLFTGEESTKQLGGPGLIAAGAGNAAQSGLTTFLTYLAFVSVSIGLVNLFPVPILDGGHLVFYALEAIRGKPLGPHATEWAARIGFSFVILLMFMGTFNDILRWLATHGLGS
jgi:regulator of sigma E protease